MHQFERKITKSAFRFTFNIGERVMLENGKLLLVSDILSVTIEDEHIVIKGYGMEIEDYGK